MRPRINLGAVSGPFGYQPIQLLHHLGVRDTSGYVGAIVFEEVWSVEKAEESLKATGGLNVHVAIFAHIELGKAPFLAGESGVAHAPIDVAKQQRRLPVYGASLGLHNGNVQMVSRASVGHRAIQGHERCIGRDLACIVHPHPTPMLDRFSMGGAGKDHGAARCVFDYLGGLVISVGARLPEIGYGSEDDAGFDLLQLGVAQTEA